MKQHTKHVYAMMVVLTIVAVSGGLLGASLSQGVSLSQPSDSTVYYEFPNGGSSCYILSWYWIQVNDTFGLWMPKYTVCNASLNL